MHYDCCVVGATWPCGSGRFDGHVIAALLVGAASVLSSVYPMFDRHAAAFSAELYTKVLDHKNPLPLNHRPQRLSSFDNTSALFTAVAYSSGVNDHEVFEIIELRVTGLKTFWTIARGKVLDFDSQMAMATPYPGVCVPHKHELTMIAWGHRASTADVGARMVMVWLGQSPVALCTGVGE